MDFITQLSILMGIATPIVVGATWLVRGAIKTQSTEIRGMKVGVERLSKGMYKVEKTHAEMRGELKMQSKMLDNLYTDFKDHKKNTDMTVKDVNNKILDISLNRNKLKTRKA